MGFDDLSPMPNKSAKSADGICYITQALVFAKRFARSDLEEQNIFITSKHAIFALLLNVKNPKNPCYIFGAKCAKIAQNMGLNVKYIGYQKSAKEFFSDLREIKGVFLRGVNVAFSPKKPKMREIICYETKYLDLSDKLSGLSDAILIFSSSAQVQNAKNFLANNKSIALGERTFEALKSLRANAILSPKMDIEHCIKLAKSLS